MQIKDPVFSESTYRQILDVIDDMVFVKGPYSNLIWANRAFCEFYGMTEDELRGMIDAPINKDNTQGFLDADRVVFRNKIKLEIPLEKIVRNDGVTRQFTTTKYPIFSNNGQVTNLVGVARDISEQIETDRKFKRIESLLTSVLFQSPSIIYIKDLDGKYLLINQMYKKIFGLEDSDIIGKTDFDLFTKEAAEIFRQNDLEVQNSGETRQTEEKAPQIDGIHTFISNKFPLRDPEGKIFATCGISTDITERVLSDEMLQEERARNVFSSKLASLGEMAAGIAHEINSPLTTVRFLLDELQMLSRASSLEPLKIQELCLSIDKTTTRIAKIVKNLRSYSRDGSQDPMVDVQVEKLIDDTLSLCRNKFLDQGIEFTVSNIPDKLQIYAREVEISQVLINLLNNAIDALTQSPIKKIALDVAGTTDSVEFSVTDSGPGIPKIHLEKIFEPFHTTKKMGQGTGLGLSISRRIVESHGGTLELDQTNSQTRFVVRLPRKKKIAS